jgi:AcrR family transcriptional regulator
MAPAKKRTTPLTRDELFERALAIVDAEGLEALTMRHLAEDVGVEAASLYYHVPNKDALLDGVLIRMRAEMRIPEQLPTDWMDLMEAIFAEYRRVLTAHPNLMSLAGRRVESDPDSGLVFLVQQGFSNEDAVDLWQSMIALTVGFSVLGSPYARSDTFDLPDDLRARMSEWRDESYRRTLRMILQAYENARNS